MQADPDYLRTIKVEQVHCSLSGEIERKDSDKFYHELKKFLGGYDVKCIFQDGSEL